MDLNDDRFVNAVATSTGRIQRIPRHWLDSPRLGAGFKLAPSQADVEMVGETPSDEWTVKQLRAYAGRHGVDLSGATSKTDVLDAITTSLDTPTSTDTALVSVQTPATGEEE